MTGSLQVKGGKYYAVLNFYTMDGKRKQKWFSLDLPERGNKRRAEAKLKDLLIQYQGFENIGPLETPLSSHIENWIEMNRPNIAVTTYDQYVKMLKLHIRPYFDQKGITLGRLTAGDLEDYYSAKIAGGLSPNTVIKHHAVIRSSLQWAWKHHYIRENVANLLQLTQNEPIAVPIFLACFYGLRRSELLGLKWTAIDFQKKLIHIDTTVVREKSGDQIITVVREGMTKTSSSKRSLPLCQYTYDYFVQVKQRQMTQMQLCGSCYNMQYLDFVCVDDMGMLLQPDYISQKFQKLLSKYNLRHIRFHDLRHSCATIMLYLGYSLKDIQTWLGHSNYNFTADTYVHTMPNSHQEMAQSLAGNLPPLQPAK